jgi:hypothetical protein
MPKLIGVGRSYQHLVANLRGGSDPSRGFNPEPIRREFRQQTFQEIPRSGDQHDESANPTRGPGTTNYIGLVGYTTAPEPVGATAVFTVADNDFTVPSSIIIGQFTLTSDVEFTVGGSAGATATAIAAAITALPGFTAAEVGPVVTVTTDFIGPTSNQIRFEAEHGGAIVNFTPLVPATGLFDGGEPFIGPPEINL